MAEPADTRWLLLIHQIPPRPAYLRVKIWRRLQRLGAVAIKNSVYALPKGEGAFEDLSWVLREIVAGGGDGSVCEARFVDGLDDEDIARSFRAAREADYDGLAAEIAGVVKRLGGKRAPDAKRKAELGAQLGKLEKRLAELVAIDFFEAPGRAAVEAGLADAQARLRGKSARRSGGEKHPERPRRATWVTRVGIHVDRMASAWLIRRFIDPEARFKFVPPKGYTPAPGELRFDMFEAEYSHEGDRCTFETLCARFGLTGDPGLSALAEIVHDLDLKDSKFGRADAAGVAQVVNGIALAHRADEDRLARASATFDDLYALYRKTEAR